MTLLAGIDVGGTFTDLIVCDPATRTTRAIKVPSDRAAPDAAVLAALAKAGIAADGVRLIVHGTTVATNALLERRGAHTGLVTTAGFRDVLELGRTTRLVPSSLYDPYFRRAPPLIARRDRHAVPERTRADGGIDTPLDEAAVEAAGLALKRAGVQAVVVGFVNSYRNPAHERRAAEILRRHFTHVTISTGVLNEIREFERFSVAAINGYVMPVMAGYVGRLTSALRDRHPAAGFYTVASHGGLLSSRTAMAQPVRTVLSGPAAGIAAALHLARAADTPNLITYDMGGTSTDAALIADAAFPLKRETLLEGLIIRLPQLDIHTVGAGGGSIAALDAGGSLQVGPESAGAAPGPAAYGRGGASPTVTDANVVLGRLGPAQELGRSLHIDAAAATTAMQPLAAALSLTPEAVAEAILRLAVAKMAAAVHEISVARGFDPRAFALLSYGGAGPLHAALIAEEIGIPRVIVPPAPGAFSAFGALCSALAKDRAQTLLAPLDEAVLPAVAAAFAAMHADLRAEFAEDGAAVETMVAERQFDLRYRGQAHELTVAAPADATLADIVARFETAFERQFGRRDSDRGIDLVNLRLVGRIPLETPAWATPQPNGTGRPSGTRRLVVDGQPRTCAVWDRDDILADTVVAGPAVIAEMSATTYLPPGWQLSIGSIGQLDLVRDGRA
jgi:N-methylhydantoinase A